MKCDEKLKVERDKVTKEHEKVTELKTKNNGLEEEKK